MTRAVVAGLDARAGLFPIRLTEGDALPFTIEFPRPTATPPFRSPPAPTSRGAPPRRPGGSHRGAHPRRHR